MKKRLNATHKKILRTLRLGAIDSQVSVAQLSGIRFGVITTTLPFLVGSGYVQKNYRGYELTAKGRVMADSLHRLWLKRRESRKGLPNE